MNFFQLIGIAATIQHFSTKAYWAGRDDSKENNSAIGYIRQQTKKTDQGWSFLTGRLATKYFLD